MTQAQIDKAAHAAKKCPTCGGQKGNYQILVNIGGRLQDCPECTGPKPLNKQEQEALARFPSHVLKFMLRANCHTEPTRELMRKILAEREGAACAS